MPWVLCLRLKMTVSSEMNFAHACVLSYIRLFATLWTVASQAPLSMGLSRQGYCSGLPFPPPGDFPDPGIKVMSLASPGLQETYHLNHRESPKFCSSFENFVLSFLAIIEKNVNTSSASQYSVDSKEMDFQRETQLILVLGAKINIWSL